MFTTNQALNPHALHEGPDRLVMIENYESEQARSQHLKGAALADLRGRLGRQAQQQPQHPLDYLRIGTSSQPHRRRRMTQIVKLTECMTCDARR